MSSFFLPVRNSRLRGGISSVGAAIAGFKCLYGDDDRRNYILFESHIFSLVVTLSLAFLLFNSESLRRVYRPLAIIVNAALATQILSDILYFLYYPYGDNEGNCAEMFVDRIYIILFMFGELHQIYFIANVLGCSRFRFRIPAIGSLSLESGLQLAFLLTALTLIVSIFVPELFMISHSVWGLFIMAFQLYIIRYARALPANTEDNIYLISANNDSIKVFENLTFLQLIPCVLTTLDRIVLFKKVFVEEAMDDGVLLILESLVIYLFYVKIIVLKEKILSDVLYFLYYPYGDNEGNCAEMFVDRIYIILFMFGELHQIYFIANVLGCSRFRFRIPGIGSLSLESGLQLAFLLTALTLIVSIFVPELFMISHSVWGLFIMAFQLYIIRYARALPANTEDNIYLISANNDAIKVFENLTFLQLIPCVLTTLDRIVLFDKVFVEEAMDDGVLLILESLVIYLFYVKIIVLKEKASSVNVEIVD